MQLFYHPEAVQINQQVTFAKEESRHIIKVLRKQEGELLHITNGKGSVFTAKIVLPNHNGCSVQLQAETKQPQLPYKIHMAVAPTKLNDRYEWFLEKATEIGVTEITPVFCDHSERTKIKPERYQKILVSAMKQSLKACLPVLNPAVSLATFMDNCKNNPESRFIAHCAKGKKKSLKSALVRGKDILVLIGPEGDFSENEIAKALEMGFIPVSLGENRLRTETAAIVACHSVVFINEK